MPSYDLPSQFKSPFFEELRMMHKDFEVRRPEILSILRELAQRAGVNGPVEEINLTPPARPEGKKTTNYEIAAES